MAGTVSSALGLVAAAIPNGSRVATLPGEFTSTSFPFAAQAARGVSVTELKSDELVTTVPPTTVAVSLVQSANGEVWTSTHCGERGGYGHADRHRRHPGGRLEGTRVALADVTVAAVYNGCWRREARRGCR